LDLSTARNIKKTALERAVVRLITSGDAVLDIALAMGFNSHEVFTGHSVVGSAARRRPIARRFAERRSRFAAHTPP
jgi:AraC-like DNA-binding protein